MVQCLMHEFEAQVTCVVLQIDDCMFCLMDSWRHKRASAQRMTEIDGQGAEKTRSQRRMWFEGEKDFGGSE